MTERTETLTPVSRLLSGAIAQPEYVTDPVTNQKKIGNDGQPVQQYRVTVAIPKAGENHWAETSWGSPIWAKGHAEFPNNEAQRPDFSWKIIDGDSTVPNKKNKVPCQQPNYPGNWIVTFKTHFAPQLCNGDGSQQIGGDQFYNGCWVQVHSTINGNRSSQSPGVHLNHDVVALSGHGERIAGGPDVHAIGLGQAPAPAGMSATPLGGMHQPQVPQQAAPVAPQVPQQAAPVAPQVPQQAAPVAPQVPQQAAPAYTGAMTPPTVPGQ